MTRPNIVRADTIDLQDQDNPSAAEHQKPAFSGGLAPHQRAEVHHVLEERDEEENILVDAWNATDDLTEEPGAIEHAQQQSTAQAPTNGARDSSKEGKGGGDAETDGDDDMMDRISSSPSIDDGGYTLHSSPLPSHRDKLWPMRKSSLSPSSRGAATLLSETFNQSAPSTPGSSPFLQTPQHLPLHVRRTGSTASPLAQEPDWSSSPYDCLPERLPLRQVRPADNAFSYSSRYHHQMGKYRPSSGFGLVSGGRVSTDDFIRCGDIEESSDDLNDGQLPGNQVDYDEDEATLFSGFNLAGGPSADRCRDQFTESVADVDPKRTLEKSPSLHSLPSVDLQDVLLPLDDPLLEIPPSPSESSGSWESMPSTDSESDNDDDTEALFRDLDDRFIDSGWGGECLQDTEDIDFEFVYALHTFVATVEGQANATKGDTMVLLDDSNSYWWLVRVVKDSSIGYLPAEHIETPTERLARLNKHRNIDLSQTMLSDNSEKSRNPLKKAMRRRNAKTVQFSAPTYYELKEEKYEDEDEYGGEDEEPATTELLAGAVQAEEALQNGDHISEDEAREAPDSHEEEFRSSTPNRASFDREQAATVAAAAAASDDPQLSPKLVDKTEAAPLKSRKTRNTDSFLKDDSIETRKITLTPGILREDGTSAKSDSSESTRNNSLDSIVKSISPPDGQAAKKDGRKDKKEKKGGMLSGLFRSKKKDKKSKDDLTEPAGVEKRSGEFSRESPIVSPLASGRNSPGGDAASLASTVASRSQPVQARQPTRGTPYDEDVVPSPSPAREPAGEQMNEASAPQPTAAVAELQGSEAVYEMGESDSTDVRQDTPKESALAPITNILKRDDSKSQKPVKTKRSKQRLQLDDFDDQEDEEGHSGLEESEDAPPPLEESGSQEDSERLSESPVEILQDTYMHGTEIIHVPTPSPYDQAESSNEDDIDIDDNNSRAVTSSPSLIDHKPDESEEPTEDLSKQEDPDPTPTGPRSPDRALRSTPTPPARALSTDDDAVATTPTTPSTSTTTTSSSSVPPWSDSNLRAWLEDGSDVKDMMVLIHECSDVQPVGDEHPLMQTFGFAEQKKVVTGLMGQLDGLLGEFLGRRGLVLG